MKSTDLKINIIDQIIHSKNDELMQEIQLLLQLHKTDEDKIELTEPMRKAINKGMQQFEEGEYKDSQQFWSEIDTWLDEK